MHGMGGVGKTQLALEYAYRHASDFDLVWWLRAEQPTTLLEDYAKLAGPLGLTVTSEGELAAIAAAVRERLAHRDRWLLVFDNANEPEELEHLLPHAGGRVLITSRNPACPFASKFDVPTLRRPASVEFLLRRTGQDDDAAADALAEQLGDLPLALEHAAAYMVETGSSAAAYLLLFCTRRNELWAKARPPIGYPATVGTTWTMAVERLRSEEPRAVDLLNLCAFLAPEAIPRTLLTHNHVALPSEVGDAVADPLRLNRLVGALRRYSLVEVTGEGLSFHRLVQAAARDALGPNDRRRWVEVAVALMLAGFPYDREVFATWAPSGALLAHALTASVHAKEEAQDLEAARRLLNKTGEYLLVRAEFEKAKDGFARALELAEDAGGFDHFEVGEYVNNLGCVLRGQGDLAGAKAAFERAIRIAEANSGPNQREVAISVNNLGTILRDLGDLAAARAASERALGIDEAIFGPDHPKVATDVNNLGKVLQELGDLPGAKAAFERALKIDEASFGPDHPEVATDVHNLGNVLKDMSDLAGARAYLKRALAIFDKQLGPEHPNVATVLINLGRVVRAKGDLTGARAAFERALGIREKCPRASASRRGNRPLPPRQGTPSPGRSDGRQGGLRAGARDRRG